jgi:hypothetical protein
MYLRVGMCMEARAWRHVWPGDDGGTRGGRHLLLGSAGSADSLIRWSRQQKVFKKMMGRVYGIPQFRRC